MERRFCDKCEIEIVKGEDHVWLRIEIHDPRVKDGFNWVRAIMREYHIGCYDAMKEHFSSLKVESKK